MPQIGATIAAIAIKTLGAIGVSKAAAAAIVSAVATTATAVATSLVVGAVSAFLFRQDFPRASVRRASTFKDPLASRQIIYGEVRTGGALVFAEGSSNKRWLYLIIVLAGHEVEEIGSIYLADEELLVDANGNGTGKYENDLYIGKHLGAYDQTADSTFVDELSGWTGEHRLRGLAYIAVKIRVSNLKVFPNFSYSDLTAVVKGRKVYDPRDSLHDPDDYTTWAYSNNAALCMADYIRGAPVQDVNGNVTRIYGLKTPDANIDWSDVTVSANTCDEQITRQFAKGGVTYDLRYTINGRVSSGERPNDVLENMGLSMAGAAVREIGGTWRVLAGEARTPSIEFDESDVMAPMTVQPRRSRRDLFNAVRGIYPDSSDGWQPKDAPERTSAFYEAQDNDERIYTDIAFPYTTTQPAVERLMKTALERNRQQIQLVLPVGMKGLKVRAGDWVYVTNAHRGWSQKQFEVVGWSLQPRTSQDGSPLVGVDLELSEVSSTMFDWSEEDTQWDDAPDTNLPDFSEVSAPSGLTLASGTDHLYVNQDGTVVSRIYASWTVPDEGFVEYFEIEYKKASDSTYTRVVIPGESSDFYISPVEDTVDYDVRIRSRNLAGATSDYITDQHNVVGKSEPPGDVTGFTISRLADGTRRFNWTHPTDRDLAGFRIKYNTGSSITWASATALNDGLWTASPLEINSPAAGTYTFAIKAVDTSGNESTNEATITATLGDPRLQEVIFEQSERDENWPGATVSPEQLTGGFINNNNYIEAKADTSGSPQGDWSSLPSTWDAMADSWDAIVPTVSPVVYETIEFDLGANVSFTPFVSVLTNGTATVQMKTGTEDDGGVTGAYTDIASVSGQRYIQIKVSVAGDAVLIQDISTLLDGEALVDRYEDIDLSSVSDPNIEKVATGHFRIATRKDVSSLTFASIIALQNVGSGYSWELLSKNAPWSGSPQPSLPSAEFKIYDSTGTLADATVDVELRGPKAQ